MSWFDYLRSFSTRREKLKERVVTSDPTAGLPAHAPQFFGSELLVNQLPPYHLAHGRLMLRSDPLVQFALNVRNAALMVAEVEITAKEPVVQQWVQKQWDVLWNKHRNKILATKAWGFGPLQIVFKAGPGGLIEIEDVKDFAPERTRAEECGGKVCGFKIQDRKLRFPQGLWLTFNSEYGSPYGTGCLRRQYPAWFEKWTNHGAKKLLQLRMLKDAYIGDIFWYPKDQLVQIPDGFGGVKTMPWRDLVRELGENRLSGAAQFLPSVYDDKNNKLLDYTPPQDVPGGSQIFEWNEQCDEGILRGADVPMEVVKASETGSGYSGRSIPFMVVLSVCTGELTEYIQCIEQQVLRPAAWLNWGGDPQFEIKPKSLVESFAQDASGSPLGGAAIGGQPGQRPERPSPPSQPGMRMGWVGHDGQVTQFDEDSDRWITIGGREQDGRKHVGGFPVQIDPDGRIVKSGGPQGLVGRHVSEAGGYFGQERRRQAREQEAADWGGRKGYSTIVARQSARWKIDPATYESIADQVWADRLQQHGEREAAKQYARKRLNLNAGDIERLENQGFDHGSDHKRIKGLDTLGREMASLFPALGWGEGYGSGDDRDYGADVWELVKEGKQTLPSKTSREYHAAVDEHLAEEWDRHKRRKSTLVDDEPVDDSQFGEDGPLPGDEKIVDGKTYVFRDHRWHIANDQSEPESEPADANIKTSASQSRPLERLRNKPPIPVAEVIPQFHGNIGEARKWAMENLRGKPYVNNETGMSIRVARRAIEKATSESAVAKSGTPNHLEALTALPDLLERAVLAESHADRGDSPDIGSMHRFYAPLRVGKDTYRVKLTVKEYRREGTTFYTHELAEIEVPARKLVQDAEGVAPTTQAGTHVSISDLLRGAKNQKGEPLIPEAPTQFDEADPVAEDVATTGSRSARQRIRRAASRIRALKKNALTPLTELAQIVEGELLALHRGLSADLAASMLGGHLVGAAEAWTSLPAAFAPPPAVPSLPPAPPAGPPSLADMLGPDEPPPAVSFPVVEDARDVLAEAPVAVQPDYRATAEAVKQGAFAITGDLTEAAVADVRDILVENLAKGPDRESFIEAVIERLGEGGPLSEARVETIFRTNVATAISDGTEKALKNPIVADAFPYRAYYSTTDNRVRKEHRALEKHGLDGTNIYRADDPVWAMFRPPWAFNCRCAWSPVSVEQAARRGVREAQEWLERAKAMAAELGGSEYQYFERTAPASPAWVAPPPFQPDPEFQRQ
jgi:SPP1 gp7 family putative phage head morphogenesis protein